jgi:hypothetical protein
MLLDSEGHRPHAPFVGDAQVAKLDRAGVCGGKNCLAAHCQNFQCEGTVSNCPN